MRLWTEHWGKSLGHISAGQYSLLYWAISSSFTHCCVRLKYLICACTAHSQKMKMTFFSKQTNPHCISVRTRGAPGVRFRKHASFLIWENRSHGQCATKKLALFCLSKSQFSSQGAEISHRHGKCDCPASCEQEKNLHENYIQQTWILAVQGDGKLPHMVPALQKWIFGTSVFVIFNRR